VKVKGSLDDIDKMIRQVRSYKKTLAKKTDELIKNLAEIGVKAAQDTYGSAVTVHSEKTDKGYTILAEGRAVCFLEFGTGVYADDSSLDHYQSVTFKVEPGSWSESEEGAHTWSQWIESGKPASEYPYNRVARPGILNAYNAIVEAIQSEAKKVFG
jgi:hypothetical protein